jgi:hypothetical protein
VLYGLLMLLVWIEAVYGLGFRYLN